jgi:hypothetical protein
MQLPPTILSLHSDSKRKNKNSSKPNPNSQPNNKRGVEESGSSIQADCSSASEDASASDTKPSAPVPAEEPQAVTNAVTFLSLKPTKELERPILRPPRTLETTLFDRLEKMYGPSIKRMLNVQYRSVYFPFLCKIADDTHATFHSQNAFPDMCLPLQNTLLIKVEIAFVRGGTPTAGSVQCTCRFGRCERNACHTCGIL